METGQTNSNTNLLQGDVINANTGTITDVATAAAQTAEERRSNGGTQSTSHFIGANKLMQLLQTPGAIGINIYLGVGANGDPSVIVVPATVFEDEYQDILQTQLSINNTTQASAASAPIVIARPCPPCPRFNLINSNTVS